MRLLIDLLHPAHVHVFRNVAKELSARGHDVRFTLREKECARELLDQYELPYTILSQRQAGFGLASEFVQRGVRLWREADHFRPHFLAGAMGPSIATVGRLRRALRLDDAKIVVWYQTEIAKLTNTFVYPLSDYVITPDCYTGTVRGNHLTVKSIQELAYLHPNRFTPNPDIVRQAGIDPDSKYFVVRFVAYEASHDIGTNSLPLEKKLELVRELKKRGRVLVTSEKEVPAELREHRMSIPASHMHHVLAYSRLLVGESATMAAESACLGVPSIYVSPLGRGFTDELERYGLLKNFIHERLHDDWVGEACRMADDPELLSRAKQARERLLADKIDLTSWMVDFFEREFARCFPGQR
jgi:predicted glycosyltransferase